MSTLSSRPSLQRYAIATSALLKFGASHNTAEAIVTSIDPGQLGPFPLTNGSAAIDVDSDGNSDFLFIHNTNNSLLGGIKNGQVDIQAVDNSGLPTSLAPSQFVGNASTESPLVSNLSAGAVIGASSPSFVGSDLAAVPLASGNGTVDAALGNFNPDNPDNVEEGEVSSTGYIGFSFTSTIHGDPAGSTHYGWVPVEVGEYTGASDSYTLDVVDGYYETEAGVSIEAGEVPELAHSSALLALGAAGVTVLRRRRRGRS